MFELECRSCSYKFRREMMPRRCPYCSEEGKVGLIKTAQDMIDDLSAF